MHSEAHKFLGWLLENPSFTPHEFRRIETRPNLPNYDLVGKNAEWADSFYANHHYKASIFTKGNDRQRAFGFGADNFGSFLIQLLFALDIDSDSFDYEPRLNRYTGVTHQLTDKDGSGTEAHEAVCGSGLDDLLPLILEHPSLPDTTKVQLIDHIQGAQDYNVLGCISASSMISFIKGLNTFRQGFKHVRLLELSRTIPLFIHSVLKYHKIEERFRTSYSYTLADLSVPPQEKNSYAAQYVQLQEVYGVKSITSADIIEYYMDDQQIVSGLGGHMRWYGSNGFVFIRAMAQHSHTPNADRVINFDPKSYSGKKLRLWNLLQEAGYTVDPMRYSEQLSRPFADTPPPLRSYQELVDLFDEALTTDREGFPKLQRVFAVPIVREGMDPAQRHYVLMVYSAEKNAQQ